MDNVSGQVGEVRLCVADSEVEEVGVNKNRQWMLEMCTQNRQVGLKSLKKT